MASFLNKKLSIIFFMCYFFQIHIKRIRACLHFRLWWTRFYGLILLLRITSRPDKNYSKIRTYGSRILKKRGAQRHSVTICPLRDLPVHRWQGSIRTSQQSHRPTRQKVRVWGLVNTVDFPLWLQKAWRCKSTPEINQPSQWLKLPSNQLHIWL